MGQFQSIEDTIRDLTEGLDDRTASDVLYERRNTCFAEATRAYNRGDHNTAKEQSERGKTFASHGLKRARAAARAPYAQEAAGRPENELDLRGLFVDEALQRVEEAIRNTRWMQARGQPVAKDITFIVGKGLHSKDGVSVLKPAVLRMVNRYYLRATNDKPNEGCVHVELLTLSEFDAWRWTRMLLGWVPQALVAGAGFIVWGMTQRS